MNMQWTIQIIRTLGIHGQKDTKSVTQSSRIKHPCKSKKNYGMLWKKYGFIIHNWTQAACVQLWMIKPYFFHSLYVIIIIIMDTRSIWHQQRLSSHGLVMRSELVTSSLPTQVEVSSVTRRTVSVYHVLNVISQLTASSQWCCISMLLSDVNSVKCPVS